MTRLTQKLVQFSRSLSILSSRSFSSHHSFCRHSSKFYATSTPAYRRGYTSSGPSEAISSPVGRFLAYAGLLGGCGLATYYYFPRQEKVLPSLSEDVHHVTNWSNTHEARTKVYLQPESLEELESVVQNANLHKQKIRAVGSGLSPNGIGLCNDGMVNLALMDKILVVDQEKMRATVQAGARVEQVVEGLKPYGLTLQNFASIKEQQIGGFIQVGAHGTGATLPPVDEQVVSLKLVTPSKGTLDLSPESDPELFYLARCGLGALGIVAEVTLQCVPRHQLLEHTFVTNLKGVKKNHKKWLREHKHLRYLWIPDTDSVVVIHCDPVVKSKEPPNLKPTYGIDEKLKHAHMFYKETVSKYRSEVDEKLSDEKLSELSFPQLRDVLIAFDPLSKEHIRQVNKVEAEFWKRSEGYRIGWSEEILGFDCGGQQWVSEIAFPVGTLKNPDLKDVMFLENLLKLISKEGIPAHSPIEQRWTSSSKSPMSPASSSTPDILFSWVGIIMYLPTEEEAQRMAITKHFFDYRQVSRQLWDTFNAHEHWAKIEVPKNEESLIQVQNRLKSRFPVEAFNYRRAQLDPNKILSNELMDQLFPQ